MSREGCQGSRDQRYLRGTECLDLVPRGHGGSLPPTRPSAHPKDGYTSSTLRAQKKIVAFPSGGPRTVVLNGVAGMEN